MGKDGIDAVQVNAEFEKIILDFADIGAMNAPYRPFSR
jgi:hypothetical protein